MEVQDIRERAFNFAVRAIKLCVHLEKVAGPSRVIGKQLLRSATSVGANLEEAQAAQSKADFISKNSIALKEARETVYWLRLLMAAEIIKETLVQSIYQEAAEITRVIAAIIVSAKKND